jgi:ATP-dependent DNA helicase DinG
VQLPSGLGAGFAPASCALDALGLDAAALAPWLEQVGPLAVVDLETTGLPSDPGSEILELGVVLLDPGRSEAGVLAALVRPAGPIPPAVARLTGIRSEEAAAAPPLSELRPALREALAGRAIVAHNAAFERHFLGRYVGAQVAAALFLDTQDLLALTHPDAPDLRLESFTRSLLGSEERHRALDDALDTARVISRVAAGARGGDRDDPERARARYAAARRALEAYAPDSPWLALLGKDEGAAPAPPPAFVRVGTSAEEPVPFDEEAIAAALRDGARGRRHWPAYRVREEQVRLARHFADVLRNGGTLLCEGGTGVGKSLAYLAAAIPFAMERAAAARQHGERLAPVVVSTRTKLLQDQLLVRDIPTAARFLGWPDLRALSIKGRANYVCERRLATVLAEGREPRIFAEDRLAYAVLATCAANRPHGEVGSIGAAWLRRQPLLGELLRRSVAARAEQCSREQCAQHPGCPFGRRRAALAQAHLVVANHDLLLRWPPDYPPFAHAIVDEAHELADVADDVYALALRPDEVLDRLDDAFGRPDRPGGHDAFLPAGRRRALRRDAVAWRRGIQQELAALGRALEGLVGEFGEVQVPEHPPAALDSAGRCAERAAERIEAVAREIDAHGDGESPTGALARTTEDLRAAASALRLAFAGAEDSVAAFEGVEPPWDRWRLAVRRVSPAEPFHEHFLSRLHAFAGVSASLFVGGDAFAALGELGIDARLDRSDGRGRPPPLPHPGQERFDESFADFDAGVLGRIEAVSVPSPFPYAEHMRVVALPDPRDLVGETVAVLAELARRLGGRTLGLFTSLRRMQDVAVALSEQLRDDGIEVLAPRRAADDPNALVERFARGGAVLLGARRYWQGLDLPGPQLQAVVIEKLPFEVPTELRRRRELRLKRVRVNAFERYTLGKMLLNLKQMVGRLVRTEEDRGVVVLVEGRTDKGYFRRLGEALPPGSRVAPATLAELDRLLAEVGIATPP